jgi:hypothetical protein
MPCYTFIYIFCSGCSCIHKCFENISEDQQWSLLQTFSSFNTKDEQDIFLSGLILVADIIRRLGHEESTEKKAKSFIF